MPRQLIEGALDGDCPYCGVKLNDRNFSNDHADPVSRHFSSPLFSIGNLVICCCRCNAIKGVMSYDEFTSLLTLIHTWPVRVRDDLLRRLYAGGRCIFG